MESPEGENLYLTTVFGLIFTLALQSCIRKFVAMVMGTDDEESLYEKQPTLTEEQVKQYGQKDSTASSIFPDGKIHIDFVRSWKRFTFNKEARKHIIVGFLDAVNKSGMYRNPPIAPLFLTEYWVGEALDGRIITLRRLWKKQKEPLTKDQADQAARKAAMSSRRGTVSGIIFRSDTPR